MNEHNPEEVLAEGMRDELLNLNNNAVFAMQSGDWLAARELASQAVALLTPEEDPYAPAIYENLGLACMRGADWRGAQRAFLRALDGDWTSRPLSLRLLVVALLNDAKTQWGRALLTTYVERFGPHPDIST